MPWRARVALLYLSPLWIALLFGCGEASSSSPPTWYRDVEPVVSEHCVACHEPGGVGPVTLEFAADDPAAYASAKPLFADAVSVLDAEQMPLWLADRSCRHYAYERSVSAADKALFQAFVAGGSQRGNPADAPAPFVPAPLERIDARLTPDLPYTPVPGLTNMDTRCFLLDPALSEAKDVIGFDVRPGSKRVHRAQVFALPAAQARSLDDADPGLGYGCVNGPSVTAALVGEYVPGVPPQQYPPDTAIRLTAGELLVLQVLYDLSTGTPEPDTSEVDLEYAPSPVLHPARFEAITNTSFSIPAHAAGFSAVANYAVTEQSTLWGVAPHLLSFGSQVHMALTQAAGDACLVDVPRWDATWEQSYFFANPASLSLAAGDSLTITCTWDNPGEVAVVAGNSADDEACVGYAYLSR